MGINLTHALKETRTKYDAENYESILKAFKAQLEYPSDGQRILDTLFKAKSTEHSLNFDQLDPQRIYHINSIKKLCIEYRLRFLDSSLFTGTYPAEVLEIIKAFEKKQATRLKGFKIIAPAPMFRLEEKDKDPALFVSLGNNYYYLLAQWGRDMSPSRKIIMYPFRSFETLLKTLFGFCALVALLFPESIVRGPNDHGTIIHIRVIFFFWMVFATSAMTALYGFSRMKNFSSKLWNSKFFD
jgi:hypothetical protein